MSTVLPETVVTVVDPAAGSARRRGLRRALRARPSAAVAGFVLAGFAFVAVFAPWLRPYNPTRIVGPVFGHPSGGHWLGLDGAGNDVVSLLVQGGRISLVVGVSAMAIGMVIGTSIGTAAGYFGGLIDAILMRVTDYFLVVPYLPLMIVIAAIWGPSLGHIILVIGVLQWSWTARIIRSQVKTVRQRPHVQRVRSLGAGHARILFRHVLPQIRPLLVSLAVLHVAYAIFSEAALDFLGLGDPTSVSWGTMIEQAFQLTAVTSGAWWAVVPPGLCIATVIVACYLLSQAVADVLDPSFRQVNLSPASFRIRSKALVDDGP